MVTTVSEMSMYVWSQHSHIVICLVFHALWLLHTHEQTKTFCVLLQLHQSFELNIQKTCSILLIPNEGNTLWERFLDDTL